MVEDQSMGGEGDTLFYSRWDGQEWSTPIDVLVSPTGINAEFPDAAITPNGMLHVVWDTGSQGEMMYSRAPACCADKASSWTLPMSLGKQVNQTTALVADERGRLHAAFASVDTHNIVYRRSDDGGATWPVSVEIQGTEHLDDIPLDPRLAVDGRGRVHAVWSVWPWPGRSIMYARSDDGGQTWTQPRVMDSADQGGYISRDYGPTLASIATQGLDTVHIIWDGAPTVDRNHIWSSDGGNTWSAPIHLIPEVTLGGRSGWNDMAVDSAGTLHVVSLPRPYHASWSGGDWSRSTIIGQTKCAELLRMAPSLGNILNVAWVDRCAKPNSVWYVRGQTTAPAIAPRPLPTPPSSTNVTSTTVLPSKQINTPGTKSTASTLAAPLVGDTRLPNQASPMNVIVLGIAPVLLIVAIIFAVSFVQSRRH